MYYKHDGGVFLKNGNLTCRLENKVDLQSLKIELGGGGCAILPNT